jgi:hypothetical protein
VATVDVTTNRELLTRFSGAGLISGYPTLLLFRRAPAHQGFALREAPTFAFCALLPRSALSVARARPPATRRNGQVYKYAGERTQEKLTKFALEVRACPN